MPKRAVDDDDDDDDDEGVEVEDVEEGAQDSDDDEGEAVVEKPKKKKQRNAFVDDRAIDDDEEDDEDEDEDEDEENEYEVDEGAEDITDKEAELENRRLDAQRRRDEDEELRKQVHERYESGQRRVYAEEEDEGVGRFQELPDATRDPRLWCALTCTCITLSRLPASLPPPPRAPSPLWACVRQHLATRSPSLPFTVVHLARPGCSAASRAMRRCSSFS